MGNKDKDKEQTSDGTLGNSADNACVIHQANRDLSHEREAALNRQIVEAIARETAKLTMHFQALIDKRSAFSLASSLKVTSGAAGFKVIDPFDWTKDKTIYQ